MRPLAHLGMGPNSPDFDLHTINEELYDQLSERGETLLESAKKDFMGDYYDNVPKPTFKELKEDLNARLSRKEKLVALKAPIEILDGEDSMIVEIYNDIQSKNYGSVSDPAYKKYRDSYYAKQDAWYQSKEKETLLNVIYSYNEIEYNKIKLQQDFTLR